MITIHLKYGRIYYRSGKMSKQSCVDHGCFSTMFGSGSRKNYNQDYDYGGMSTFLHTKGLMSHANYRSLMVSCLILI